MSIETYGRYQLVKKLATGGMAQIFLARQLGLEGFEKVLVVKRILPHLAENEDFITMFLDEARIAARLNHPNIVQIYDLGSQDDTFYIAMEYIHGEDARRTWKQSERLGMPLPVPLVCRIIIEAASGLDYAHKRTDPAGRPLGIVHRDISPQNILVSFEGGVKVVDFGIAKAADQATITRSGVLKGKYSYMSPEQAAGARQIDHRTDIFALGVVMYELLTGTRLFKRGTDIQTLNAVGECKVTAPSQVNSRVPAALDAIVMKALARERYERYAEARFFASAIEDWLLAEKIPSSPVHLASFMQEIYADRLMREAEEGRLLFSESTAEAKEPPEEPPSPPAPQGSSPHEPTAAIEVTAAEPPPPKPGRSRLSRAKLPAVMRTTEAHQMPPLVPAVRASALLPVPLVSMPTADDVSALTLRAEPLPPKPWWLVGVAAAVAVAVIIGALFVLKPVRAKVHINSDPPGAMLRFAQDDLPCETPCQLPSAPAGTYALSVIKPGYAPFETNIAVPPKGEVTLTFPLANQDTGAIPRAGVKGPQRIAIDLTSQPPGATVTFSDGSSVTLPTTIDRDEGRLVSLRVEMPGYATISDTFTVLSNAAPHVYELKQLKKEPVKKVPGIDPNAPAGTVRFMVTPGAALVKCDDYDFGQTPFKDQRMPAGEYTCTFTSTKLNKKVTRVVKVEANKTNRVAVDFD